MKALLLATAATVIYLGLVTALFRARELRHRAAVMTRLWLLTVPLFLAAYLLTPPHLGLLPSAWGDDPAWAGLAYALLAYGAAFCGGVLQLYNLAERGFSLRVLIDADEAGARGLTLGAIMRGYGRGRGIAWMYQKRLDDLQAQGLVAVEEGLVRATPRGKVAARVFGALRRFLRLDEDA